MASKKKSVVVILTLLAFCELIRSMGIGKFNKMFPLPEEAKKCFKRAKNTECKHEKAKDTTQWHHWGNSSYKFINTANLTWEEAANACSVMMGEGAHLVFIESELEDMEVTRVVNVISQRRQGWWIGLTDKDSEGVWKWYNVTANYTNWRYGQPDNFGGNDENCGEIRISPYGDLSWNDNNCNSKSYFICENETGLNTFDQLHKE